MKLMSKAIHILLIDDSRNDDPFIESFQAKARDFGMKITHFERGKKGLEELKLNQFKYQGIILDARCIWDENKEHPDDKFLNRIIAELERVENELNVFFPAVVNTAFVEDFQEERELILGRGGDIFFKSTNNDEEGNKIFNFLKDKIENSEVWKFKDVFEIFDKNYLDTAYRKHLVSLLKTSGSTDPTVIKQNLALIRSLQEEIYQTINKKDKNIVPDSAAFPNVSFWKVQRNLLGNKDKLNDYRPTTTVYQNNWIDSLSECIYKISSDNGSHNPYDKTPLPSKYTVQSLTFAFLEQLLWFKEIMDSH